MKKPRGPRRLYQDAARYFRTGAWNRGELSSKRLRMTIRLLALEEVCREQGIGVIPNKVLDALEMLSDYKEASNKRYYRKPRHFRWATPSPEVEP